jgi:hypothetical protein
MGNPCNPELGMKFFQFQAASCTRHLSRSSLCLYGKCPRDALVLVLKDFNLFFRRVPCSLVVRCCEAHRNLLGEAHLNQNQPALQRLQMSCSCKYRRCMQHVSCQVDRYLQDASTNKPSGFRSFHRSFPIQLPFESSVSIVRN